MAVVIRMARAGTNNKPFFHVVVTDTNNKRDGKYLERLGTYNPKAKDDADKLKIDMAAAQAWIKKGAQVSETIGHFLKAAPKSK